MAIDINPSIVRDNSPPEAISRSGPDGTPLFPLEMDPRLFIGSAAAPAAARIRGRYDGNPRVYVPGLPGWQALKHLTGAPDAKRRLRLWLRLLTCSGLVERAVRRRLRELRDKIARQTGAPPGELSMGMSHDYEVAVEEGAVGAELDRLRVELAIVLQHADLFVVGDLPAPGGVATGERQGGDDG